MSAYTSIKKSLLEITSQDALLDQNKLLTKQIETLIETLNKLPQQLDAMQPAHSSVMQIGGCNICGGVHESSMCMAQDDASKEVNYMANPNRQGFHQGRPLGSHTRNNINKDQGSPSIRSPNQGPNLHERTTKLEDTLTQFINQESRGTGGPKQLSKRSIGSFMANIEKNPKEECKVVLIRSQRRENNEREMRDKGVLEDLSNGEGEN
ncbi:hypothetical protein HKD37_15G044022 [Glycine soja]